MVTLHGNYAQFKFYRPGVKEVHLAGDFNHWDGRQLRMLPTNRGDWIVVMKLSPGVYRFRYCADGQWFTDYAAFGVVPGPFGTESIVRVDPENDRDSAEDTQDNELTLYSLADTSERKGA